MPLASLLLSVGDNASQVAANDVGSPIVLFLLVAMLIALTCAAFIVAAVASGLILSIVGAACVAIIILAALAAAVASFNFALATLVWTRRPPLRRWMSAGWWGTCTLVAGPPVAIAFWWLHYHGRPVQPSNATLA